MAANAPVPRRGSPTTRRQVGAIPPSSQAETPNKLPLYLGIGAGAIVLIIIIAVAASSGGDEERGKKDRERDKKLVKVIENAREAQAARKYEDGLKILAEVINASGYESRKLYKECLALSKELEDAIALEQEAKWKAEIFKRKFEEADRKGALMSSARELRDECVKLLDRYRSTAAGTELEGEKQRLDNCIGAENEAPWEKEWALTKGRIDEDFLKEGDYAAAAAAWKAFGVRYNYSGVKVTSELDRIDGLAGAAAKTLVGKRGVDQATLEAARGRFAGTAGQKIIDDKIAGMR